MLRLVPLAFAALLMLGPPSSAGAQNVPGGPSPERLTPSEFEALTKARIAIVKIALQTA